MFRVREGRTESIFFALKEAGVAIDLSTLFGVTFVVINQRNEVYHYTLDDPELALGESKGEVVFTPPTEDFFIAEASPYICYFWLYTSADARSGCPSAGKNIIITVLEVE